MRSSCIYTNNLNYFCCFNYSKGNKFPNLKCWTTGTFFNTSAINIFVMPVLTLFHDKRDAISFNIGECSKNGPRLTYSLLLKWNFKEYSYFYLQNVLNTSKVHVFIWKMVDCISIQYWFWLQHWVIYVQFNGYNANKMLSPYFYQLAESSPIHKVRIDGHPNPILRDYQQVLMNRSFVSYELILGIFWAT